jgi:hypothetical protein
MVNETGRFTNPTVYTSPLRSSFPISLLLYRHLYRIITLWHYHYQLPWFNDEEDLTAASCKWRGVTGLHHRLQTTHQLSLSNGVPGFSTAASKTNCQSSRQPNSLSLTPLMHGLADVLKTPSF